MANLVESLLGIPRTLADVNLLTARGAKLSLLVPTEGVPELFSRSFRRTKREVNTAMKRVGRPDPAGAKNWARCRYVG